jgi:hypothetical protein
MIAPKQKSPAIGAGPSWPRHAEDGKRAPEASAWWLWLTGWFAFFSIFIAAVA